MKLYIDTSSNKQTAIHLGDKEMTKDSSVWRSQVALPMIASLGKLSDITEIEYVGTGPSSTGIRVGAAIANALGFALQIPVKVI